MRHIPDEMVARIESGAATLCHVWRMIRVDGVVLGFTDHDRELTIDGTVCHASGGWAAGVTQGELGATPATMTTSGVLDDAAITEADILAGLYDGAKVEQWRVDWMRPDLKVRLSVATLSRIRREGDGFVADLEGPLAALDRVVGRTYGRGCDAVFGDDRCGVDVGAFPGRSCDKRWRTCVETFDNAINLQGFPDIPGDDFLTLYPGGNGRLDGGSRR